MITKKPGGGRKFGVRHLQLLFAHIHGIIDGMGIIGLKTYLESATKGDVDGSHSEESLLAKEEVQLVLSCMFLMSAATKVVAPFIILTLNNKYLAEGITIVECAFFCAVVHTYKFTQIHGLIGLALVIAFTQSIRVPLGMNAIAKWMPPREHTRAMTALDIGGPFGRIFVDYFVQIPGIRANLFYILAGVKFLLLVTYFFFGAQDPQTCWILKSAEWNYLCREIGYRRKIQCDFTIPYKNIFRTPMVYGLMCSSIAKKWFETTALRFDDYLPGYENAAAIPMMLYPFIAFGAAWAMDVMIDKDIITKNNLRKIASCFVHWGSSICICFMCFYCREPTKVVVFFVMARYFASGFIHSELSTLMDMSPNYSVELHTIYAIPSYIIVAIKTSWLDPDFPLKKPFKDSLDPWYYTAMVTFIFNYGFLMFGNIGYCQFDTFNAVDWRKESQMSYP